MTPGSSVSSPSWADGDRADPEPGALQVAPGVEADDPVGRQSQADGVIPDRLGQGEDRPGRGRHEVGQGPRIEVVGMLVAGQDQVDARAGRRRAAVPGSSGRAADPWPRISSSGAPTGRGRSASSPVARLDQEAALTQPPDAQRPRSRDRPRDLLDQLGTATDRLDHRLQLVRAPASRLRPSPWPWRRRRAARSGRIRSRGSPRPAPASTYFNTVRSRSATSSAGSIQVFLTSTSPTATSIVSGSSAEQLDLGHLPAGELERELVRPAPGRCAGTAAGTTGARRRAPGSCRSTCAY